MTGNKKEIIVLIALAIIFIFLAGFLVFKNKEESFLPNNKENLEKINYDGLDLKEKREFIKRQLKKGPGVKTDREKILKQLGEGKKTKEKKAPEELEKILKQLES